MIEEISTPFNNLATVVIFRIHVNLFITFSNEILLEYKTFLCSGTLGGVSFNKRKFLQCKRQVAASAACSMNYTPELQITFQKIKRSQVIVRGPCMNNEFDVELNFSRNLPRCQEKLLNIPFLIDILFASYIRR